MAIFQGSSGASHDVGGQSPVVGLVQMLAALVATVLEAVGVTVVASARVEFATVSTDCCFEYQKPFTQLASCRRTTLPHLAIHVVAVVASWSPMFVAPLAIHVVAVVSWSPMWVAPLVVHVVVDVVPWSPMWVAPLWLHVVGPCLRTATTIITTSHHLATAPPPLSLRHPTILPSHRHHYH